MKQFTRAPRDYIRIVLSGFAMGICEIIPGVSGGTMAFILGIYEELIQSIRDLTEPNFIQAVTKFNIKRIFEVVNWKFLVALAVGMFAAILTLSSALEWLLQNRPSLIWSFFFGLVISSIYIVSQRIKKRTATTIALFIVASVGFFLFVSTVSTNMPSGKWFLVVAGAIAICAFILPGVSGSFILVVLGKYDDVLGAVNDRDILTLGLVAIGCLVGLITFARVVGWLFDRYHDAVVATLMGLMLGSLRLIWPWKQNPACLEEHIQCVNILPDFNGALVIAIICLLVGMGSILLIERLANISEPTIE
jgi:putative membrane protein